MDVVFRFAERITVMVEGVILTEGVPQDIAADERVRAVYLGQETRRRRRVARRGRDRAFALELDDVSAGYGETVVLEKVRLALKDGETRLDHRPQRRRQDHAGGDHHGPHHRCTAAVCACTARNRTPLQPIAAPWPG